MMTMIIIGISLINIAAWTIIGIVVGVTIYLIDKGDVTGGVVAAIIIGILGAMIGGLLSPLIFGTPLTHMSIQGILTAFIAAVIAVIISRIIFRITDHIKVT